MELAIIILSVAAVAALTAWRVWEHQRTRRALAALTDERRPALPSPAVSGHPAFGGWHFTPERSGSTERYAKWHFRFTVQDVLPSWLMMDWSPDRAAEGRGTPDFLPAALFGPAHIHLVPRRWTVMADAGDLVVQGEERHPLRVPSQPDPEVEALGRRLAAALLTRGTDTFREALVDEVARHGTPEALRLLLTHFGHHPDTRRLAQSGLTHPSAALRVAAAQAFEDEAEAVLQAVAEDLTEPESVRRSAVHALARRRAFERVLQVGLHSRYGVEDLVAEALAQHDDPRVEHVVLPFLEHDDHAVAAAAAEALARQGTSQAVPALKARLARRPPAHLRTALEVAIRLIQDRGRGATGGLAVVPKPTPAGPEGRVSMLEPHQGHVSPLRGADEPQRPE
ncbi:MAG: HEAT repeat domain-containing protein [Myxococcales bacterium]|nr:HEAT repeat domain-containing protein [Myxococcales bacterium]